MLKKPFESHGKFMKLLKVMSMAKKMIAKMNGEIGKGCMIWKHWQENVLVLTI